MPHADLVRFRDMSRMAPMLRGIYPANGAAQARSLPPGLLLTASRRWLSIWGDLLGGPALHPGLAGEHQVR